jgi:hypothetical protein
MWRSPLPKGVLEDPHLAHIIASSAPSSRDLRRSERVRPAKLQDVNILGDVWSILVLANYNAALDRRHCISSLVLSTSDICGDLSPKVDGTVCTGDTILHNKRQQWDVIQSFSVTSTRGRREAWMSRSSERIMIYESSPLMFHTNWRVLIVTWKKSVWSTLRWWNMSI